MLRLACGLWIGLLLAGCGTPFDPAGSEPAGQDVDLRVAAPILQPAGGTYDGPVTVTLGCDTPGVRYRYTIDGGGTPSQYYGDLYVAPIRIDRTTQLHVVAFAVGRDPSKVVSATYTLTN